MVVAVVAVVTGVRVGVGVAAVDEGGATGAPLNLRKWNILCINRQKLA